MKYIYVFICLIILKFILNLLHYLESFRLEKIWYSYFAKNNVNAITYTKHIQNLFKNAGLKDNNQPFTMPTGYNQIVNTTCSIYDNIFSKLGNITVLVQRYFLEARGIYRKRMFDSFNPLYWLDLIINLPKNFFEYLGLDTETIFTKIFQLIYWIVNSVLLVYYREQILKFIQNYFTGLFK